MRVSNWVRPVVVCLALGALVAGGVIAFGQAAASFSGTYVGVGTGTSTDGDEGSSPVIVWMIEGSDGVEYTAQIEELGMVVDAGGPPNQGGPESFASQWTVTSAIAHGSGDVAVENERGTLNMLLSGSGGARGYEGQGSFAGQATDLPQKPITEQITDMASAIGGKPPAPIAVPAVSQNAGAGGAVSGGGTTGPGKTAPGKTATGEGATEEKAVGGSTSPGKTQSGNPVSRPLSGSILPPVSTEESLFGASILIFLIFLWTFICLFFSPLDGAWMDWDEVMHGDRFARR